MEEYISGKTDNLHDYLIPTFGDVPPIESILVEVPDPEGPFGAKGLGDMCRRLERESKAGEVASAGDLVAAIEATLERVQTALRAEMKETA